MSARLLDGAELQNLRRAEVLTLTVFVGVSMSSPA